jgi:mRNA-degrading endonuclease RelE of RelBE toxin-antitoxin system
MKQFTLHIPKAIAGQLRECRVSVRASIRERLKEIVEDLTARLPVPKQLASRESVAARGPPLRFYVFEGYRVSYQVNPVTRRVVVLGLQAEPG